MEPEPREEDGDLEHGVTQQVLKKKTYGWWLNAEILRFSSSWYL